MVDRFYIQAAGCVGNCLLWWRMAGGYTTKLAKAEIFSLAAARKITDNRSSDVAWPCEYIDSIATPMVDIQDMKARNQATSRAPATTDD